MKADTRLGVAAALGLIVAFGSGFSARGQVQPADAATAPFGNFIPFISGGPPPLGMPARGTWAQVINVTAKWMVVQSETGQQFPIASDHVRQFLIRWPLPASQINSQSMLEVTGSNAGSNVIVADHLDVYENEAQNLVSPTVTSFFGDYETLSYGNFQTISAYGTAEQDPFSIGTLQASQNNANPARKHVVGHAVANDPIQVAGNGMNWYSVQPSTTGMTITQVTLGSNSFARRGDLVYVLPQNIGPRSVEVSQLVLYKKVPLRGFQP